MNKLASVVGYHIFYTAYMKSGGFNPVIDKLTDIWIGKNDAPPGAAEAAEHQGRDQPRQGPRARWTRSS
jgi:hypothetical protein